MSKKNKELVVVASLITLAMVSAFKRKDLKEVGALILDAEGKTGEAQELRDASRFTVALIDRTLVATDVEKESEAESQASEEAIGDGSEGIDLDQDVKDREANKKAEVTHGSAEEHKAIVKAIKKGKGKKALKLIAKAREGGARGSVLKDLEKQAKAL